MTSPWRTFGRYDILPLLDGIFEADSDVLIHAKGDAARRRAIEACGPKISIDVYCFALRSANSLILIDAGTGSFWGPGLGHARRAMAAAGISPAEVKQILLTHIHGDHAMGLIDEGSAYFPQAEVLVPQVDLAYFTNAAEEAATAPEGRSGFQIAQMLVTAYQDRIRPIPNGTVLDDIEAKALPGHTPGHTGYLIGTGQDRLLLWGDLLHLFEAQAQDPDLGVVYDIDAALAVATRRAMLADAATDGLTVAGAHVRGFGRVLREKEGEGFRIEPV